MKARELGGIITNTWISRTWTIRPYFWGGQWEWGQASFWL